MSNLAVFPSEHTAETRYSEADVVQRLDEERQQLARELHDVVAYSFATILVQARVAARLADDRPQQLPEALSAIKSASEDALAEFRRILGGLRGAGGIAEGTPSLDRLESLADSITSAGVPTRIVICGRPRSLPPEVDRAAFRIIQESLTNVLRHAHRATASVVVSYAPQWLLLAIEDDGRSRGGRSSYGTGNGIRGMRERAERLGGALTAGERPGGGFRVSVSFPTSVRR